MTAPRSSRVPKLALAATTAIVSAALVVTAGPATLAAADRLITGQDVADRSIQKMDLADGAVRSRAIRKNAVKSHDIRNGTITAEDLDAGLDGVVGPAGPAGKDGRDGANGKDGVDGLIGAPGVPGAPGPSGQAKPDGVATWTIHHEANGQTSINQVSTDQVPAGALIEPLAYTFTGDYSSCSGMMGKNWSFGLQGGSTLLSTVGSLPPSAVIVQTVKPDPAALVFKTSCAAGMPPNSTALPVPSFDASMTFQWTVRDTTPTRSFN